MWSLSSWPWDQELRAYWLSHIGLREHCKDFGYYSEWGRKPTGKFWTKEWDDLWLTKGHKLGGYCNNPLERCWKLVPPWYKEVIHGGQVLECFEGKADKICWWIGWRPWEKEPRFICFSENIHIFLNVSIMLYKIQLLFCFDYCLFQQLLEVGFYFYFMVLSGIFWSSVLSRTRLAKSSSYIKTLQFQ